MTLTLRISFLLSLVFCSLYSFGQMNPKYVAQIGLTGSGKITKGQFLAQQGVQGLRKISQSHWEPITVDSFCLIIMRDSTVILVHRNRGNFFDTVLTQAMKGFQANDLVLVFNIYAFDYGNKIVQLPPLEYRIE